MLTDTEAIATWGDHEPESCGTPLAYRCTACAWTGRGEAGLMHYRATGHAIRGRRWPASWPDAQFSALTPAPYAVYVFDQPDFKGGTLRMYNVVGGPLHRSTVTEATARAQGIEVRE